MKALARHAVATLLAIALALALYHRFAVLPLSTVGVVDVAEVYRDKEAEFMRLLTDSRTEQGREQAIGMAQMFSQRLPVAMAELAQECGCLVMPKASFIGAPNHLDLTPALRRKVDAP